MGSKMARIVASVAMLACSTLAAPQFQGDSSNARILQEQRFNAGAGKFGSAFAQEDGVVYREESGGNNERIGQYSYIGDDARPTLSSTPLESTDSESLEVTIFLAGDRPLLRTRT